MMSNITELPPHENMSVNQVLDHIKRKDLKKVLVIGIDEYDKLITRSSKMIISEAVYFLELAKYGLMEVGNE
jgi:Cdc6-like AAA superfamily ATPase